MNEGRREGGRKGDSVGEMDKMQGKELTNIFHAA